MTFSRYKLQFPNISGLDARELQEEIGPAAQITIPERQPGVHGDLGLVTIGVVLGAKALTAALLYFGRKQSSHRIQLSVQIIAPDGTVTNVQLDVESNEKDGLSEQAMKQISTALKLKPSDLVGLE